MQHSGARRPAPDFAESRAAPRNPPTPDRWSSGAVRGDGGSWSSLAMMVQWSMVHRKRMATPGLHDALLPATAICMHFIRCNIGTFRRFVVYRLGRCHLNVLLCMNTKPAFCWSLTEVTVLIKSLNPDAILCLIHIIQISSISFLAPAVTDQHHLCGTLLTFDP